LCVSLYAAIFASRANAEDALQGTVDHQKFAEYSYSLAISCSEEAAVREAHGVGPPEGAAFLAYLRCRARWTNAAIAAQYLAPDRATEEIDQMLLERWMKLGVDLVNRERRDTR